MKQGLKEEKIVIEVETFIKLSKNCYDKKTLVNRLGCFFFCSPAPQKAFAFSFFVAVGARLFHLVAHSATYW